MKRLRFSVRRSRAQFSTGKHTQSLGLRVGYWPCLKGPFITLHLTSVIFEIWYGLPSYKDDPLPGVMSWE